MSTEVNQPELSKDEIAEMKKRTLAFYKDRIAFMKVQCEYEKLSADIEEHKLRGLMATLKYAHITAPQEEEDEEEKTEKTE